MAIRLTINGVRGYTTVSAFLLCMFGLSLGILVLLEEQYVQKNITLDQKTRFYYVQQQCTYMAWPAGVATFVVGCVGLIGVIKNVRKVILTYNVSCIVLFAATFAMGIVLAVKVDGDVPQTCTQDRQLQDLENAYQLAYAQFCTQNATCACDVQRAVVPLFSNATRTYLLTRADVTGSNMNFQSCPGAAAISAATLDNLVQMETYLACSGFCAQPADRQFYCFTNINRGQPSSTNGCFAEVRLHVKHFVDRLTVMMFLIALTVALNLTAVTVWLRTRNTARASSRKYRRSLVQSLAFETDESSRQTQDNTMLQELTGSVHTQSARKEE